MFKNSERVDELSNSDFRHPGSDLQNISWRGGASKTIFCFSIGYHFLERELPRARAPYSTAQWAKIPIFGKFWNFWPIFNFLPKLCSQHPKIWVWTKNFKIGPKMAELRAFFVNPSKIPDEPLEVVFAHIKLRYRCFRIRVFQCWKINHMLSIFSQSDMETAIWFFAINVWRKGHTQWAKTTSSGSSGILLGFT